MELAPRFLIQFMLKLVKLDLLDVMSTSTTVLSVLLFVWVRTLVYAKVHVSRLLQDTLAGLKHPQTVSIFICTLASKWPRLLVPLTASFRRVMSNLHVEYPWAQSSLTLTLRLLALASNTFGLGLDNAVLEHIPGSNSQKCAWSGDYAEITCSLLL